jgi:CHAT domain-containing protein
MPDTVVHRIRALQHIKPRGADVRIQTGDPRIPFELLLVPEDGTGDCDQGARCEFLGVLHSVSRWHVLSALGVSPEERTRDGKVAVIAPTYQAAALQGASKENESLKELAGSRYQLLSSAIQPLVASLGGAPPSVLHYAGHGEAPPGVLPAMERYALRLEDGSLDLDTFRQHTAWLKDERGIGPLVFLNACDIGRAEGAYGFAEGWGPVALQQGAAGFIGGLWPLGDSGAADFARQFYQRALKGIPVAEALRQTRDSYRSTADPTYMAYVYYGHPQLRISEAEILADVH